MNKSNKHLDERGMIKYDGTIPPDAKLLAEQVNVSGFLGILGGILASTTFAVLLKLAFLAFTIYSFFNKRNQSSGRGSIQTERGFGFSLDNTIHPDTPLSIIYGEHRFAPHIFYQKLSNLGNNNRLDYGLGIGEGEIDSISEVKINDIEFDSLEGVNNYDLHVGDNTGSDTDKRLNTIIISTDYNDEIAEEDGEVIRTGVSTAANELEIGLVFPQGLYQVSDTKGPKAAAIEISIFYKRIDIGGQPWITISDRKKITAKHRGEYRLTLALIRGLTEGQYQIKIVNHVDNRDTFKFVDTVLLDFFNEYTSESFLVPKFAYLGMTLEATSSLQGRNPQITMLVKGRKVRVYSNPSTYNEEWSDNPAWCLLDLLTHDRYGLGYLITHDDIDIQSFEDVADYLDEIDTNGARKGQLDVVVNSVRPALDWVELILSTFSGILRTTGGKISLVAMKDEASVQAFTMANINAKTFKYQYADPNDSSRINRIRAAYFNRDKSFSRDIFTVEASGEIVSERDVVEKNVDLFGITRELAVERQISMLLNSLRTNIRSVEWESDVSTIQAQVGDVVTVSHELAGWTAKKFRILEIEETQDQSRVIRALEHNAEVFNESGTVTSPIINTTLWNPLTTATPIESLTLVPINRVLEDGTIENSMGIYWTVATGTVQFFGIDHYEVYASSVSGTVLASGTEFDENDANSQFFTQQDGTVVSGALFSPFVHIANVRPPETSYELLGVTTTDFYNIGVVPVTNNFISIDIANAVTAAIYATTYSGQPTNTTSFSSAFAGDDIKFTWAPVPQNQAPNLLGYEIRNQNASWGEEGANLIFRGLAVEYLAREVNTRSQSYWIKSFNTNGIYSTTALSTAAANAAPAAITQNAAVILGRTARINWTPSAETDVTGYRIHVSDTSAFSPSTANLESEVLGKDVGSYYYQEQDDNFPTRYVKITAIDALSNALADYNYSNEVSFTASAEAATVDAVSINLINDSDFNGISPVYWTTDANSSVSSSKGHVINGGTLRQNIPFPDRRIQDANMRLSIFADAASEPDADLTVTISGTAYSKQLTVSNTSIGAGAARFGQSLSVGSIPSSVGVEISTNSSVQINVDKAMLHTGSGTIQWVPHTQEIMEGYTDWIGTTQIIDGAIITNKIAANAVTAAKIAAGTITANEIATNTITATLYSELRQTLYYRFSGELDADNPLNVVFHLPSELQAAGDIIDVKVSYFRHSFRSTAETASSDGAATPTSSELGIPMHKHLASYTNSSTGLNYIYMRDGIWWVDTGRVSRTANVTLTTADSHVHLWQIQETNQSATASDYVIWQSNGKMVVTNSSQTIEATETTAGGETHKHLINVPSEGSSLPTTGRIGFLGLTPTLRVFNGSSSNTASTEVVSLHSHTVGISDHQHAAVYGIFEEASTATVAIRRSDDGEAYEGSNFTSSSNASRLDVDLDSDTFFSTGAGAGFKGLQFRGSGANNGRARINGIILVKCDIDA